MLLTFYGQFIYDSERVERGIELLVRGEKELSSPVAPDEIFKDFNPEHFLALDMQIISYLNVVTDNLKSLPDLKFVFVNFSDVILKELIYLSETSVPTNSIFSIAKKLSPLKLVVEVSEQSRILPEHMSLIVQKLQENSILVAQDDFDKSRVPFLKEINWDFIKIDADSENQLIEMVCCAAGKKCQIVFERALSSNSNCTNHYYQGFALHKPVCLSALESKNKTAQNEDVGLAPKIAMVT